MLLAVSLVIDPWRHRENEYISTITIIRFCVYYLKISAYRPHISSHVDVIGRSKFCKWASWTASNYNIFVVRSVKIIAYWKLLYIQYLMQIMFKQNLTLDVASRIILSEINVIYACLLRHKTHWSNYVQLLSLKVSYLINIMSKVLSCDIWIIQHTCYEA